MYNDLPAYFPRMAVDTIFYYFICISPDQDAKIISLMMPVFWLFNKASAAKRANTQRRFF